MNDIPKNCIDSSNLGLMLETLQNSVYQLNQEEIRAMFVNLVVNLADKRKNSTITLRYIYILSQLGYDDAVFLRKLVHQNGEKLLHAHKATINARGKNEYISDYFLYFSREKKVLSGFKPSINVLDSLGVRKDSDERLESKIEDNNIVKKLNEKAQNDQGEYWLYKDIFITSFGMDFLKCVIG
ncbi:MAG: Abi-alpha family protein [Turicibacter bilis]